MKKNITAKDFKDLIQSDNRYSFESNNDWHTWAKAVDYVLTDVLNKVQSDLRDKEEVRLYWNGVRFLFNSLSENKAYPTHWREMPLPPVY